MPTVVANNKIPIGITLPIRNGGIGFFEQTFDTFSSTRTNIINLLRTKPGERRMQPLFGCRLYDSVFEQNTEILPEYITNIIKEDIGNWIPNVTVNAVNVKFYKKEDGNQQDYKIYIYITFTINVIEKTDTLEVVINTDRI
jgi:phage baseplate assembly protein W